MCEERADVLLSASCRWPRSQDPIIASNSSFFLLLRRVGGVRGLPRSRDRRLL